MADRPFLTLVYADAIIVKTNIFDLLQISFRKNTAKNGL